MKMNRMNGLTVTALLLSMLALPAVAGGIDRQVPVNRTVGVTKADISGKNAVMARNTTTKTESVTPATAPAKAQKTQDKKAVGRCWSRLMGMFREINLAHRSRTK